MIVCEDCGNINFHLFLTVSAELKTSEIHSTLKTSHLAFEVRCSSCDLEILDEGKRQTLLKTLTEKKEYILEED